MKTIEYILDNYKDFETVLDDRFGVRFCQFLTQEQAKRIGFKPREGVEWAKPIEWTKENILKQLAEDVDFGFEKAIGHRGISSSLMADVVKSWNKVLEEGLEGCDEYYPYGIPIFRETALKYGFKDQSSDFEYDD